MIKKIVKFAKKIIFSVIVLYSYNVIAMPLKIIIPDGKALTTYSKSCRQIKLFIEQKRQENNHLNELQSLLLSKLGQ